MNIADRCTRRQLNTGSTIMAVDLFAFLYTTKLNVCDDQKTDSNHSKGHDIAP